MDITLPGGVSGHLAIPDRDGPWPGVVVLHEVFGLNDEIRRQTDRFATEGYLAFAPDLFTRGPKFRCIRQAFRELSAGAGPMFDDIDAAREDLAGHEDCSGQTGVIGFCMGGGFALVAAARYDFDAASVNYGMLPGDPEKALAGVCPVVAGYGTRDIGARKRAVRLEETLAKLEVPHDVKLYTGVGHSFLGEYRTGPALTALRRVSGMSHDPDVAADAWKRIFAFFDEHVRNRSTT